ncbi:hypothetical protein DIPPA_15673, partial [Diplonema papillatum]
MQGYPSNPYASSGYPGGSSNPYAANQGDNPYANTGAPGPPGFAPPGSDPYSLSREDISQC